MTATKNYLISMEQIGKKGAMNVQHPKFGQNDLESSNLNQTPNGRWHHKRLLVVLKSQLLKLMGVTVTVEKTVQYRS
jgi:hypothetical protein